MNEEYYCTIKYEEEIINKMLDRLHKVDILELFDFYFFRERLSECIQLLLNVIEIYEDLETFYNEQRCVFHIEEEYVNDKYLTPEFYLSVEEYEKIGKYLLMKKLENKIPEKEIKNKVKKI